MPRKWHPQMPAYLGPSVKVPESLLSWFISRNFVSDMTVLHSYGFPIHFDYFQWQKRKKVFFLHLHIHKWRWQCSIAWHHKEGQKQGLLRGDLTLSEWVKSWGRWCTAAGYLEVFSYRLLVMEQQSLSWTEWAIPVEERKKDVLTPA